MVWRTGRYSNRRTTPSGLRRDRRPKVSAFAAVLNESRGRRAGEGGLECRTTKLGCREPFSRLYCRRRRGWRWGWSTHWRRHVFFSSEWDGVSAVGGGWPHKRRRSRLFWFRGLFNKSPRSCESCGRSTSPSTGKVAQALSHPAVPISAWQRCFFFFAASVVKRTRRGRWCRTEGLHCCRYCLPRLLRLEWRKGGGGGSRRRENVPPPPSLLGQLLRSVCSALDPAAAACVYLVWKWHFFCLTRRDWMRSLALFSCAGWTRKSACHRDADLGYWCVCLLVGVLHPAAVVPAKDIFIWHFGRGRKPGGFRGGVD